VTSHVCSVRRGARPQMESAHYRLKLPGCQNTATPCTLAAARSSRARLCCVIKDNKRCVLWTHSYLTSEDAIHRIHMFHSTARPLKRCMKPHGYALTHALLLPYFSVQCCVLIDVLLLERSDMANGKWISLSLFVQLKQQYFC